MLSNLGRKDEIRVIRRKDHIHQKQPTYSGSAQQQQCRLMDLFSDSNLEKSRQKQNSFLSLLPPPPRTMSKILPPSLSTNCQAFYQTDPKTAPTQIMKNSQAELQEASAIVETDKDELLNGISKFIKKPIEMSNNRKLNNLLPDQIADDARKTHIRTSLIGLTSPSKIAIPAIKGWSVFAGGYNPQRTAPAVQTRSVIPVCAAPPPNLVTRRPSPPTNESVSTQVSPAFSKLNL